MLLKALTPLPALQPYVAALWVFESDFGVPMTSSRVIAPNGKAKIILPYCNALYTRPGEPEAVCYPEGKICFIGPWEMPVTIGSTARKTGTLGIELTPTGAYRLASVPLYEMTGQILGFDDIYGNQGLALEKRLTDEPDPIRKARLLQDFLQEQLFSLRREQAIVDFSARSILTDLGRTEIRSLEQTTGYSRRYLTRLFQEHVGMSPKTLAAITRFQQFYHRWAQDPQQGFYREDLYAFYYDQSHFIKEFRRFTGFSPNVYAETDNEFGRIFYRR